MTSKAIFVCCDGTRNDAEDQTHVWRLHDAISRAAIPNVVAFYDEGVGTNALKGTGSVFGAGISANIRQAYRFLAQTYVPGDDVHLVGFSRGAYTVRSLASLIGRFGLLPKSTPRKRLAKRTRIVYRRYRLDRRLDGLARRWAMRKLGRYGLDRTVPISTVAVFDTVGSVGASVLGHDGDRLQHWYHDMSMPKNVQRIAHAVSLDEQREDYTPHLLPTGDGRVVEAWFPGAHADVGGGYKDKTLGSLAYRWMVAELGLDQVLEQRRAHGDAVDLAAGLPHVGEPHRGTLHSELDGPLGTLWRKRGASPRSVPAGASIHRSVIERWKDDDGYRPAQLDAGWMDGLERPGEGDVLIRMP